MSRIRSLGLSLDLTISQVENSLSLYCDLAVKLRHNKGKAHASKLLKEQYNVLKMYALGCNIPKTTVWCATYSNGLPKQIVKVCRPLRFDNDNHIRWLLSLFSLYETWKEDVCLADLETLTLPSNISWNAKTLSGFCKASHLVVKRMKSNNMVCRHSKSYPKDYLSLKGGPIGQATLSAHHDAKALLANRKTLSRIKKLQVSLTGNPASSAELHDELLTVSSMSKIKLSEYPLLRTLAIPDKGPKVRTITIGNYYLQRSLKEVHNLLMNTLRRIPEDGTYKQDKAAQCVKHWTSQGIQPWCFDLTSATDRFPVIIQYIAIKELYPEIAHQWYSLMRKAISYDADRKRYFEFGSGQPMGLYSSWAAFSITHHILIRYAFRLVSEPYQNNYYIIGDDVAIKSGKAAAKYRELIQSLGISISLGKSITPENIRSNASTHSAELAKRYFRGGVEISPVRPWELEALSGKGWPLLLEAIPNLIHRWGEENTRKLVNFDPSNVSGHFLTWADQAHRKTLMLVSSHPRDALLKGVIPKWWPAQDSVIYLTAWQSVESTNTANLLNKVYLINEAEKKLLRIANAELDSSDSYLHHPLHKALTLVEKDLTPLYRKAAEYECSVYDIHALGVNLELLETMLKDNKTYNDYKSFRLKRTLARAQTTLDIWSQLLFVYEHKPKDDKYPRVKSQFTINEEAENYHW